MHACEACRNPSSSSPRATERADLAGAVPAERRLTPRAAFLEDRGLSYTRRAAIAKLCGAETAMTLATRAVRMHAASGYRDVLVLEVRA